MKSYMVLVVAEEYIEVDAENESQAREFAERDATTALGCLAEWKAQFVEEMIEDIE